MTLRFSIVSKGLAVLLLLGGQFSLHAGPEETLQQVIGKMSSLSSFRANVTFNNGISGVLSYKKPHQLHFKLSDGRVISANGIHLWFFSPGSNIAGKQKLYESGGTGGLAGLLSGYSQVIQKGNSLELKSPAKYYSEIIVQFNSDYTLRSIKMMRSDSSNSTIIQFTGIQTNLGLSSGLFNYSPPSSAQIVENPLDEKE